MRLVRKNLKVILVFIVVFNQNTNGQPWLYKSKQLKSSESTISFSEIQSSFNNYWIDKEITKGSGHKPFRRWEQFIEPRLGISEQLNSNTYWNALQNKNSIVIGDTIQWDFVGPISTPLINKSTNKAGNGRLNCIAFHPEEENTLYVGAPSGGLWVSEDGGQNWTTTTDLLNSIGISDIVISTQDTNTTLYIATGDGDGGDTYAVGIIKSVDNGVNWEPTALSLNASNQTYFRRLIMHPENADTMLATSSKGIYKTIDGWNSYSLIIPGDFKDIEFHPSIPSIIYATSYSIGGDANIYLSTDGGNSFSITNSGLHTSGQVNRIEIAVSEANSNIVYALFCSASSSGFHSLYRSSNSGDSWSLLYDDSRINLLGWSPNGTDIGGQGHYDLALAVSPLNSDFIFVGGINIWRSRNGGTDWRLSSWLSPTQSYEYVHADQHMIAFSPHTGEVFSANDGGLYKSVDNGYTWTDISNNLQILQSYKLGSSNLNSKKLICGNQDNGTILKDNTNWNMLLGGDGTHCYIDPTNDETIYLSSYYGDLRKSIDNGNEFSKIKPAEDINGAWVTPFIIHPHTSSTLYAAYKDVYKTTDAGESWIQISEDLSQENLKSLSIAPSNDNYIYAASFQKLYKTTDGGGLWEEIPTGFSEYSITSICISPNDPNKIWLSLSGFNELDKVYFSANGGLSWTNFSSGLPNVPVNKIIMRYNSHTELFAATDIGVFYRNADTSNWVSISQTLPNVIISDIEIIKSFGILRVATYGRGIWETSLPDPIPSKANFEANINTGCINAPIVLHYTDSLLFDSLVWNLPGADVIQTTSKNDSITISYSSLGKKTVQLSHYKNDSVINEIKYEYLDIRDTLDISLSPNQYYICDSSKLNITLRKGYDYIWSPNLYLDTTIGNMVNTNPLESITYVISAQHGTCYTFLELPIIYQPDNICNADYLNPNSTQTYSNHCASTEVNEPIPPVGTGDNGGCISQDGWCNNHNILNSTLWYKLVVPENGYVRISVNGFDSKIALYSAQSCDDLFLENWELIAANDDIDLSNTNSLIEIEGLTPGDTLYLQVDGPLLSKTEELSISLADYPSLINDITKDGELLEVKIYPNPSFRTTSIKIDNCNEKSILIELISQNGKVLHSETEIIYSNSFETEIYTENLKGVYIVRISSKNQLINKKLIVL